MENLYELRDCVGKIGPLERKRDVLNNRLYDAQMQMEDLLTTYEREQRDVVGMQKDSFSGFVLNLFHQYEAKLEKEKREALEAKIRYDEAVLHRDELSREKRELEEKLAVLHQQRHQYEVELAKRREWMEEHISNVSRQKYQELDNARQEILSQIIEVEEATRASIQVKDTALRAMNSLESADKWATYDIWMKGGIFAHQSKYRYIDDAESDFYRLSYQIEELRAELRDIQQPVEIALSEISPTQKMIDFWFDNVFTDSFVRSQIRDNMHQLDGLIDSIHEIGLLLEVMSEELTSQLKENQRQQEDLLCSIDCGAE